MYRWSTIDLADFDDDLSVGNHTVVVRHTNDMYDTNFDELGPGDCKFIVFRFYRLPH